MKLKQQITLLTSLALIVPAVLIGSVSIYRIQVKATADIEEYRNEEYAKLKLYLKHITDIAYGVIEEQHKLSHDSGESVDRALAELSKIRFDNNAGYFWVTDNNLPFPTMLMHAEKPELKNKILDDPKHNVEKEKGRNIYQVRAELANANGDAFVDYIMKKPGTDEVLNKISYSRLYKPLGWIVSTGFYTDTIEAGVTLKKEALSKQINNIVLFIVIIGVTIQAIGLGVSFYFSKELTNAIVLIRTKLKELAEGKQVEQVVSKRKDEVGDMTQSLNLLVNGLKTYTSFAKEIGKGNLHQNFEPLSGEDVLGTELLLMRDNLKTAEHEKGLRDWANEGMAKLGDVLRRNNTNTKKLTEEILGDLVRYLKVNQGALFIMTNDGQQLELASAYAYGKRKFVDRKIDLGDGLTGQCVLERQTIHLTEVPKDYVQITSGLGQALPRTIIVVPLIHNEKVFGVLEMASFKAFENYEIAFIEKIGESIASTISTVQTNEQTKVLLEQSQQMSEELRAQEEEVRQNMEELSATQESMTRQIEESKRIQQEFADREGVLTLTTILSETDLHGNILLANDKLCAVSKYSRNELIGKPYSIFRHPEMPEELFTTEWNTLKSGQVFKAIIKNRAKDGSHFWVDATIAPIKDEHGNVAKYTGAQYHLTDEATALELYNHQAKKMGWPVLESNHKESNGQRNGSFAKHNAL